MQLQFSRAVAFASFTALKWLSVVACVLFAALAIRFYVDGNDSNSVMGAMAASLGAILGAYVLHFLAQRIRD